MWSFSTAKCTRCHAPGGSWEGTTIFLRNVIYKLLIKTTASNTIWVTVCISSLPDSLYRVKESQDVSTSCKLLRAKELPWERQTSWSRSHWADHALEFQLQEGVSIPSHSQASTCSYPKQILLALLPTARSHQASASTTSLGLIFPLITPTPNRTLLTLSPLLSTLHTKQLSRVLSFEVARSSSQYLFLAPICVQIPILTEHPWCFSHSDSWNTHRPHATHHLQHGHPYPQEPHWSFSLHPNMGTSWRIFAGLNSLRVPFNFGAIFLGKFHGLGIE